MFLNKNNALVAFFVISIFGPTQIFGMEEDNNKRKFVEINNNNSEEIASSDETLEQDLYNYIISEQNKAIKNSDNNINHNLDLNYIKNLLKNGIKIKKLKKDYLQLILNLANLSTPNNNYMEICRLILEINFFDINEIITAAKLNLLQIAAINGNAELTKLLLENKNINPNYHNDYQGTPLFLVINNKLSSAKETVEILLNHPSTNVFIKLEDVYSLSRENKINCLELANKKLKQFSNNFLKAYPKFSKKCINKFKQSTVYQLIISKLEEWKESLFDAIKKDKKDSFDKFKFCIVKLGAYQEDDQGNNILHCAIFEYLKNKNKDYIYEILSIAPNLLYRKNKAGIRPFDLALQNMSNDKENVMKIILDFAYKFKAEKDQETKVITNNNTENGKEEQK